MRNAVTLLAIGLSIALPCGCSTSRFSLAKKDAAAKPPKTEPDVEVKYGFPWKKQKEEAKVAANKDYNKDLEEQLSKAKQASNKQGDVEGHLKLASAAEHKQDLASAQREYQAVLVIDPNHAEAHHRLGVIADMQRKPDLAESHYSKALAANRRNPDLLSDVGYSHSLRGNTDQAERFLKEAVELNPYHQQAWNNLGQLYGKLGQYDQALAAFRKAGDDRKAQLNMAEYFPNGRPNSSDIALVNAQPPAPAANSSPGAAPPFPSDGDQTPSAMTVDQMKQRMEQERLVALQQRAQKQHQEFQPEAPGWGQGAANNAAVQQPRQSQPGTMNSPNVVLQPSPGLNGQPPRIGAAPSNNAAPSMPPGPFSALLANTPGGAAPPKPATPAVPNQKFWQGGLNNQTTATPAQPAMPTGQNPWANQPGQGFDGRQPMQQSPADAQRWAAQMAMGAGPGSMFPVVTPGPSAAQSSGYATGPQPPQQQPIQQLNAVQPGESGVENAIWWNDPSATGQQKSVDPALYQSTDALAPQSPWNQPWNTPAPQMPQWNVGPSWSSSSPNPAQNPPPDPVAIDTSAQPPAAWQNETASPNRSNQAGYRGQPGSVPPTWPAQQQQPPNASPQTLPPQTTVPNWPYAPNRP